MELYKEVNSWGKIKTNNIYEILKTEWKSGRTGETSLIKNIVTGETRELRSDSLVLIPTEEARGIIKNLYNLKTKEAWNIQDTINRFEEKHGY